VSRLSGTEDRIASVQRNSLHYFQRPDAKEYRYDPTRSSLTGSGTRLWLNKQSGNVMLNAAAGYMSPGFDVNDIGFLSRADVMNAHVGVGYKWTETTAKRKYQDVLGALFATFDHDGNRQQAGVWAKGFTEFQNNHSWEYGSSYNPGNMSNRRTRGGPLMATNPGYEVWTYYDTDGKSKFFWFVNTGVYTQPAEKSNVFWFNPGFELKPVSNIFVRFEPGYERVAENAQYITVIEDPAATETYGSRYVFARLDQRTFSAGIRLNWAFSPNKSLQFYGQPLVSIGEYTDYKHLARGATYDFNPEPIADGSDDFNFKSLRANAIFRWEYRPGSTLFLVWNHNRVNDELPSGSYPIGPSVDQLWNTPSDNTFMAKLTYYFTL